MILVDTTVWSDIYAPAIRFSPGLLERGAVVRHPWVTGELALGNLQRPEETLRLIGQLPQATVATAAELAHFIEQRELFGVGGGTDDVRQNVDVRAIFSRDTRHFAPPGGRRRTQASRRLRCASPHPSVPPPLSLPATSKPAD